MNGSTTTCGYLCRMLKIVITGPESCGKTTLAQGLGEHFKEPVVEEYARTFLLNLSRPYVEEDLLDMALGQLFSEDQAAQKANRLLFCDTDVLTLRIWCREKYGAFHKGLNALWYDDLPQLYLVCSPDLPWEPDPHRENPLDRDRLFDIHLKEIERAKVNYAVIKGENRLPDAIRLVEGFLEKFSR